MLTTITFSGTGELTADIVNASLTNELTDVIIIGYTSIGDKAFLNAYKVMTVTMTATVTIIGDYAFQNALSLVSIYIPPSIVRIGIHAFYHAYNLLTLNIPSSVTSIGSNAFRETINLLSVTVDISNNDYSSDNYGVLFNKNKTVVINYPAGNTVTSYIIPSSVTNIGCGAFYNANNLVSISIPNSVITIEDGAFEYTINMLSITIPSSINSIGLYTFYGSGIRNVTFETYYTIIQLGITLLPDDFVENLYGAGMVIISALDYSTEQNSLYSIISQQDQTLYQPLNPTLYQFQEEPQEQSQEQSLNPTLYQFQEEPQEQSSQDQSLNPTLYQFQDQSQYQSLNPTLYQFQDQSQYQSQDQSQYQSQDQSQYQRNGYGPIQICNSRLANCKITKTNFQNGYVMNNRATAIQRISTLISVQSQMRNATWTQIYAPTNAYSQRTGGPVGYGQSPRNTF